jgi:hybrid cluster-associated redox disulfide protein
LRQRKEENPVRVYSNQEGNLTMGRPTLNPDMTVADLLREWPETIPIFIKHRMACVGCSVSAFETIRGAAGVYQLPFESFVEEIQEVMDGGRKTGNRRRRPKDG